MIRVPLRQALAVTHASGQPEPAGVVEVPAKERRRYVGRESWYTAGLVDIWKVTANPAPGHEVGSFVVVQVRT